MSAKFFLTFLFCRVMIIPVEDKSDCNEYKFRRFYHDTGTR